MLPANIDTELRIAFYEQVAQFAALHSLPVAYPAVGFDPAQAVRYLAPSIMGVPPDTYSVGGEARLQWICQINISARDGAGEIGSFDIASLIAAQWPFNSTIQGSSYQYTVSDHAAIATPLPVLEGWFTVPVSWPVYTFLTP